MNFFYYTISDIFSNITSGELFFIFIGVLGILSLCILFLVIVFVCLLIFKFFDFVFTKSVPVSVQVMKERFLHTYQNSRIQFNGNIPINKLSGFMTINLKLPNGDIKTCHATDSQFNDLQEGSQVTAMISYGRFSKLPQCVSIV